MSTPTAPARITIVGGGFSGASLAIQLVRRSVLPLAVTIVEPRDRVGPGLAYSGNEPDHRLNAPSGTHSIDPVDAAHFTRWCEANGVFERDPDARLPNGAAFVRRRDFGAYVEVTVREHMTGWESGSTIEHRRERAVGASLEGGDHVVTTDRGGGVRSALLVVATGNPLPRLPSFFAAPLLAHPAVVADPLGNGVPHLDPDARVLVVGSGLTALDIVSTLLRRGHRGGIDVVSRHGLRPRPHGPAVMGDIEPAAERPLDRILAPVPAAWAEGSDEMPTARAALRRMRQRVRELEVAGQTWHAAMDELRESVWQVWPRWPAVEKRRFLRTLRAWYDVHRFRAPPQNEAQVRGAEAEGSVRFRAARVEAIEPAADGGLTVRFAGSDGLPPRSAHYGAVVNCSGLDVTGGSASNPFLAALLARGWLQPDASGVGFAVDAQCRALDASGRAQPGLRVIGPPSAGTFGDPVAVVFIATQIHRIVPDLLETLRGGAARAATADKS